MGRTLEHAGVAAALAPAKVAPPSGYGQCCQGASAVFENGTLWLGVNSSARRGLFGPAGLESALLAATEKTSSLLSMEADNTDPDSEASTDFEQRLTPESSVTSSKSLSMAPLLASPRASFPGPPPGLEPPPMLSDALAKHLEVCQDNSGTAAKSGLDGKTTAMIQHVPSKMTQSRLAKLLCKFGFAEQFDFLYMPMDTRRKTNRGVAFVNFTSPDSAERFFRAVNGKELPMPPGSEGERSVLIRPADVQGFEENAAKHAACQDKRLGSPLFLRPRAAQREVRARATAGASEEQVAKTCPTDEKAETRDMIVRFCGYCGNSRKATDHLFCMFCGARYPL